MDKLRWLITVLKFEKLDNTIDNKSVFEKTYNNNKSFIRFYIYPDYISCTIINHTTIKDSLNDFTFNEMNEFLSSTFQKELREYKIDKVLNG